MTDQCAPAKIYEGNSCISLDHLIKIATAFNKTYTSNSIKLYDNLEHISPVNYKEYLVKELDSKIKQCKSQRCWTEQKFMKNIDKETRIELKTKTFRPVGPKGKFQWLSTININDVMEQYEDKYDNFKFLGTVPMNFDDIPMLGIKDLNLDDLRQQGKTKLGIVFNLDEHWKGGSHWVSMYSDLEKGQVFYFDSYGVRPEKRVRNLVKRFKDHIVSNNITSDIGYNTNRHQYKNSECGVYSINFIVRMLRGEKFDDIIRNKVYDEEINKCRGSYFNKK